MAPATGIGPDRSVEVTGTFTRIGGPLGTPACGVAGEIIFAAVDGAVTTGHTDQDGRFSVTVAPGRYIVTGIPQWSHGRAVGAAKGPVDVPDTGRTGVEVICVVR